MAAPKEILDLIERFERNVEAYKKGQYNETQLRREFLDPFFKQLGWDIDNTAGYAEPYKEVVHEDQIRMAGAAKAPDYSFRIGGARKFFLEAKKPSIYIKGDPSPAFQLRRYAWTEKLPLSILTDFEEFAVYDGRFKPVNGDDASVARIFYCTYKDYVEKWDWISSVFSRTSILQGAFDKYAESTKSKRGTTDVDEDFLSTIESWRKELAQNLALRNPALTQRDLNFAVQRIIDRIIFLRICEDRAIEDYGRLRALTNGDRIYPRLCQLFEEADARYNSGLFHFQKEKGRSEEPDGLTLNLELDDKLLRGILRPLYYPDSPYAFSHFPADILGQVYEQFLGKVIRLTPGHRAEIDDKPEVKKAGGVYYTPTYIVKYIVEQTVGRLLETKTPKQASNLRIVDPACGSGSFLIEAYQHLLDWHLDWYSKNDPAKHSRGANPALVQVAVGAWKLTIDERKRILLNNIYGVDIDSQAVETTKLSLLLKVLEGETNQTLQPVLKLFHQRALPDLASNIKCGNSLVGPDFYSQPGLPTLSDEDRFRINVFDWRTEFPEVFQGGDRALTLHDSAAPLDFDSPGVPLHGSFSYKTSKKHKAQSPSAASAGERGFDAVIGNPPYIRMEAFKPIKGYLASRYTVHEERADIYSYFLERGLQLLRPSGLVGMIVSNKFLKAKYGLPLRKTLSAASTIRLIADFAGADVFKGATVRTLIIVAEKRPPDGPYRLTYVPVPKRQDLIALETRSHSVAQYAAKTSLNIDSAELQPGGWQTISPEMAALLRKLSAASQPLQSAYNLTALFGIKTGLNEAFIVSPEKARELIERDKTSREVLRPILFGKDIRRYYVEPNRQVLIYCHPDRDVSRFPAISAHLAPYKSLLLKRATKQQWFELQQPAPNLLPFDKKPKIVYPIIANECRFTLDTDGYAINDKAFLLPTADTGLLALLNSRLANFYFSSVCAALEGASDRYLEFRAQYVNRFPIPLNFRESPRRLKLAALAEANLELVYRSNVSKTPTDRTALQRQISAADQQIDALVYELYGLTEDEIKIVEGNA